MGESCTGIIPKEKGEGIGMKRKIKESLFQASKKEICRIGHPLREKEQVPFMESEGKECEEQNKRREDDNPHSDNVQERRKSGHE